MARLIDSGPGCPTPTPLRGASAAEARGLVYDDAVKMETDDLYPLVQDFITPMEWPAIAPLVAAVNRLKKEKNAVILAHNYMTPDIFPRGLFARRLDHGRRCAPDQGEIPELPGRDLRKLYR